jgi:hypothetical protein
MRDSIATFENTHGSTEPFLLTAPVVLSDPKLMDSQWELDGVLVQRKVTSKDHNGKPKVVQIWAPASGPGPYVLSSSTKRPLGDLVPSRTAQVSMVLTIDGKEYVATYNTRTAKRIKTGPYAVTFKSFDQFKNGAEKLLGVHFYVTYYTTGLEVAVRVNNGILNGPIGDGFNGQVYFDSLKVIINGQTSQWVKPLVIGQKHLIMPMQWHHARYFNGAIPKLARGATGNVFCHVEGFGAENQKLPTYTDDFVKNGLKGFKALDSDLLNKHNQMDAALHTGIHNSNVDLLSDRIGMFMPLYIADSGSGAPGGWGIQPMDGLGQSQTHSELLKLEHMAMMDRHSVACFDASGEYLDTHKFADANRGVQPFYHNVIGGWKVDWNQGGKKINEQNDAPPYFKADMGHPYNHGTCPYEGAKYMGGLRDYEYVDDAHYCRVTRFAKALAYLLSDEMAIDDLTYMGEFLLFSWGILPHVDLGWTKGHSVKYQLEVQAAHPHQGGWIERAFGWTLHSLCDVYALASDDWRVKNLAWFKACETLIDLSQMPNGMWQRESAGGHLWETAKAADPNFPNNSDVAGAIYQGIVCAGITGLVRGVLGASPVLTSCLEKAVQGAFKHGPYANHGLSYYIGVGVAGAAPAQVVGPFAGGLEAYNGYWTLLIAYQLTRKQEYLDLLTHYAFEATDAKDKVKKLFQAASGWDDKIPNAGYYIGMVQNTP